MSKPSSSPWKIVFWTLLLGLGFIGGVAWKSADTTDAAQQATAAEGLADPQPVAQQVSNTSPSTIDKGELSAIEQATISLFEEATPSVCFITTTNLRRSYYQRNVTEIPRGTGSGFIWDKEGHIVTNYHVIQGADRAQVTMADQTTYQASLVGVAPEKDIAVLKIDAPRRDLRPIPVGTSNNLRVGQSVFAIGNPFGLDQTLTTGVVSALGREIKSVAGIPIRDAIQTDAAINPGNSGGPLLNSSGALIGINTAIYSPSGASAGIGFSIPVDAVNWVVPELITYGEIKRPTLGIEIVQQQVMDRLGLEGVLVAQVSKGSAAERAGIRPTMRDNRGQIRLGDIIIRFNGVDIKSYNDLFLELEKYDPGEEIELFLLRDEEELTLRIRLDPAR